MNYIVTLAMPVYNVASFVEKALLSALNQTYDSIEFLLIDDKGTDNSMDIVRQVISGHPRGKDVRIIEHHKNIGLGATRNTAIDNATGKYIFFMDSDDEITENCIEILYQKMQETPVDFVAASFKTADRNGNLHQKCLNEDKIVKGTFAVAYSHYLNKNRYISTWNKLYDLQFLRNYSIKCIPTHLNEDILFIYQVVLNAYSCRYVSNITYYYYCDTLDSIVNTIKDKKVSTRYAKQYVEIINFSKEYINRYQDTKIHEIVYRNIIFQIKYFAVTIADSTMLSKKEKKSYLKDILIFPMSIKEIRKFNNKLFFFFMYLIFIFPCTINSFKIINAGVYLFYQRFFHRL